MDRLATIVTPLLAIAVLIASVAVLAWAVVVAMPGESHRGELPLLTDEEREVGLRLQHDVHLLAGEIGERNIWSPAGLELAAQYIEQTFKHLGYRVRSQRYDSQGETVRNIEATLEGQGIPEEVVLIGAHYDTVQGTVGANDNASGVAALLELARAFAGTPQVRTLRFVAFVNEEQPFYGLGAMGSQHYAREAAGKGERIVAMYSLETIGCYHDEPGSQHYPFPFNHIYPDTGDFIAFVGDVGSRRLVRRSVEVFREHAQFPSQGVAAPRFVPGIDWSDHASFWPYGVPAIMVTDTALYRYPHYHTPEDRPDELDYARMARVVRGLAEVVRQIAQDGV